MENPKDKIYSVLNEIALEMVGLEVEFKVERPKDAVHGDFSSNIALILHKTIKTGLSHAIRNARRELAKSSGKSSAVDFSLKLGSPLELAKEIVSQLGSSNSEFDKIEAIAPGFINFYLSKKYLFSQIQKIIEEGNSYGSLALGKGKKVSVEFVSANPTGPLHIGNARGGPLGDTIANVLQKAGFAVTREYLQNDVGGQVDRLGEAIYFHLHPDQKQENYEVQYQGKYIKELAVDVEEALAEDDGLSQGEFIEKAGKIAVKIMLDEILKDCELMGIKFDKVTKESDLRHKVPEVLEKIKKSLKENEGALWFAPNDEFLKDRETVVKKSNGQFTYFAADIVYHNEKMMQNDVVIDILGANHSGHVPRLMAIVKALGFDPNNLKVILYQWIRLKRGEEIVKMSKRAGTFVTAREVLDEVGKDAFRFFLLMQNSSTHMDFDLDLAKKKASDNPVFYVQYAYTRICSIFKKAGNLNFEDADLNLLKTDEEINLIRHLISFPGLVEDISQNFTVNLLANYALEIASHFHKFYEANQVITDDKKLTYSRLALLKATQITLKNTLDLLGVSTPEKM